MLEWLLQDGRIADLMLAIIVVEVLVLCGYHLNTGRGPTVASVIANAGAGGSLMVALKFVLQDFGNIAIAGALLAALAFHVTDLRLRWPQA